MILLIKFLRLHEALTLCALIVYFSGCSTTPITEYSASIPPANSIYNKAITIPPPSGKYGSVTFLRDKGLLGSACTHIIKINGEIAFALNAGEFITIYLPPAEYFFILETGGGLCPNVATSQELKLSNGQKAKYRILIPSDTTLRLTRIQ